MNLSHHSTECQKLGPPDLVIVFKLKRERRRLDGNGDQSKTCTASGSLDQRPSVSVLFFYCLLHQGHVCSGVTRLSASFSISLSAFADEQWPRQIPSTSLPPVPLSLSLSNLVEKRPGQGSSVRLPMLMAITMLNQMELFHLCILVGQGC